jgi:hypothetical protein
MDTEVKKVKWYPAISRREFEETKQLIALENWKNDDDFTLYAKKEQQSNFALTFVRCSDTLCSVKSYLNLPLNLRYQKKLSISATHLLENMQGTVSTCYII